MKRAPALNSICKQVLRLSSPSTCSPLRYVATTVVLVISACAQQAEDLQQQLQQLKRQYEETTQQLQARIAALEQQIQTEKENRERTLCAIVAGLLVTTSMLSGGHTAMWSILAVGLFNSIMFPTIFTLGVAELGPITGNGSGILNMAIVGGAILPLIQRVIADHIGLHHAFFVPVICYLYILFYALSASKPNSERYA